MFSELGKQPISSEEIRLQFTIPYMKFWNLYFPDLSQEKEFELYSKYIHEVGDPQLYSNSLELIQFLYDHEWKLFVVSSDPFSKLLPEIEKSGFAHCIQKVIGEVHEKAESISSLISEFQLDKNQTYYVWDTTGDVEAGKIAGTKTIWISWGFQHKTILEQSNPDFLIDDIIEIKNIVR
jgi:phosphoglycolate phosphatase-like HAD superfamily hydrolase